MRSLTGGLQRRRKREIIRMMIPAGPETALREKAKAARAKKETSEVK
jgi:hypothetical protein